MGLKLHDFIFILNWHYHKDTNIHTDVNTHFKWEHLIDLIQHELIYFMDSLKIVFNETHKFSIVIASFYF